MIRTFETDPWRLFYTLPFAIEQAVRLARATGIRQRVLVIKHPLRFRFQISPVESA